MEGRGQAVAFWPEDIDCGEVPDVVLVVVGAGGHRRCGGGVGVGVRVGVIVGSWLAHVLRQGEVFRVLFDLVGRAVMFLVGSLLGDLFLDIICPTEGLLGGERESKR